MFSALLISQTQIHGQMVVSYLYEFGFIIEKLSVQHYAKLHTQSLIIWQPAWLMGDDSYGFNTLTLH